MTDRRLIEDYIPIREISAEASREKSIRKGHISTLHLWWARRPLVAARAAVYAALVPAPQSPEERAQYEQEMIALCRWQLSDDVLNQARERILAANDGVPPKVLDMFAGGGAIPLEALRLGCEAYAVDLNPVAHLIQLCTLVYPQQYGERLVTEVERWGNWVLEHVRAEIGDLYPAIDDQRLTIDDYGLAIESPEQMEMFDSAHQPESHKPPIVNRQSSTVNSLTPVAYLWTRTVQCPNPACGATVPLVRQTWLAKKSGRFTALKMIADPTIDDQRLTIDDCSGQSSIVNQQSSINNRRSVRFQVVNATSEEGLGFDPAGFSARGNALCPFCGSTVQNEYVKAEGKAGRMGVQPMAIVCTTPGKQGKTYLSVDDLDPSLLPDEAQIQQRIERLCEETGLTVPDEPITSDSKGSAWVIQYGLKTFDKLFSARQLLVLLSFCKWVRIAYLEIQNQGVDDDFAKGVCTYLGLMTSRLADWNSTLCNWISIGEKISDTYARHALPMVWDYSEINPFGNASGNVTSSLERIVAAIQLLVDTGKAAIVDRNTATRLTHAEAYFDAIITDPPYYDNVAYADLSDFFYVWLKRSVSSLYLEHFSSLTTPKKREAVADATRHYGSREQAAKAYEQMMAQTFGEARRVLKPGSPLVVVYAHKTTLGWSTLVDALRFAGFIITEAWPLDTERKGRAIAYETAALASSIFIVARKREGDGVGNYGRDVRPLLYEIARERVATLRAAGVSGADLVIACVGAGLRAYTQFARVELPNGEELAASTFLDEVQRAVLEVILADVMGVPEAGVGTVDKISQYYVLARYQYGSAVVDFDEANVLARGVGVELDGPDSLTSGPHPLVKKTKTKVEWNDYRARGAHDELGHFNGHEAPLIDVLQRLLWLNDHQPAHIPQFLMEARTDVGRLKLVAEALGGKGLASEPSPGAARDERNEEQKAIGRLLPVWKRVVEEQVQGRMF